LKFYFEDFKSSILEIVRRWKNIALDYEKLKKNAKTIQKVGIAGIAGGGAVVVGVKKKKHFVVFKLILCLL
jgi:hypothetical protein